MIGALILGLTLQAAPVVAPVEIPLVDRNIRLRDLAEVANAESERDANPIIARLPQGEPNLEIDAETAKRLIRNRLPFARITLSFSDRARLVAPQQMPAAVAGGCFAAAATIEAGRIIYAEDTRPVACEPASAAGRVEYDRSAGAPRARLALAPDTYLGAIRPAREARLAGNETVTLVTGSGNVSIAREVTTAQSGKDGERVFVRTGDGDVFAVPFANLQQDRTP